MRSEGSAEMKFVITGINLYEGGPLSIYYDCLDTVIELGLAERYEIVAFVHRLDLFSKYKDNGIEMIELPKSRRSYINRFYYEYFFFYQYSKRHDVDIWLSLHDMTPRVRARKIYTYCHNVSPFMSKNIANIKYSFTNVMFSYLYKYIYRINIKSATAIIVQTEWMRDAFRSMYPINEVIVARPNISTRSDTLYTNNLTSIKRKTTFIYPAYPRYFKNFEVLCEAAKGLDEAKCEVVITLDGTENAYARDIYNKYSEVKAINWIGIIPREEVFELYEKADCLVFSSRIETWGLPISEFKKTNKDIILVNLPYAKETLGEYEKVMFFDENDSSTLRKHMNEVIDSKQEYTPCTAIKNKEPYAESWRKLLEIIVS